MSDFIKKKKSVLPSLIIGGVLGGLLFLLVAFVITQLGESFDTQRQVKSTLAVLFFDYPSLAFRIPLSAAGYSLSPGILFFSVFSFYVFVGAVLNLIWTKIRSS